MKNSIFGSMFFVLFAFLSGSAFSAVSSYDEATQAHVYHGSSVTGLKSLKPRDSTHMKNWVYAAKDHVIALLFVGHCWSDFDVGLGGLGTEKNPYTLVERYESAFKLFEGQSGSLYTLSSRNFSNQTNWEAEVVSDHEEAVLSEEIISDVWHTIQQASIQGKIHLVPFAKRSSYIPAGDIDLVEKAVQWTKMGHQKVIDELKRKHPSLVPLVEKELSPI